MPATKAPLLGNNHITGPLKHAPVTARLRSCGPIDTPAVRRKRVPEARWLLLRRDGNDGALSLLRGCRRVMPRLPRGRCLAAAAAERKLLERCGRRGDVAAAVEQEVLCQIAKPALSCELREVGSLARSLPCTHKLETSASKERLSSPAECTFQRQSSLPARFVSALCLRVPFHLSTDTDLLWTAACRNSSADVDSAYACHAFGSNLTSSCRFLLRATRPAGASAWFHSVKPVVAIYVQSSLRERYQQQTSTRRSCCPLKRSGT